MLSLDLSAGLVQRSGGCISIAVPSFFIVLPIKNIHSCVLGVSAAPLGIIASTAPSLSAAQLHHRRPPLSSLGAIARVPAVPDPSAITDPQAHPCRNSRMSSCEKRRPILPF